MEKVLSIKISGPAGQGIKSSGYILAKSLVRAGFFCVGYSEYPSLIMGGNNTYQISFSQEPLYSQKKIDDVLFMLDKVSLKLHQENIDKNNSLIIADPSNLSFQEKLKNSIPIPLEKLTEEAGGTALMKNNVGLGVLAFICGLNLKYLNSVIEEIFANKGTKVIELNKKCAESGFSYMQKNFPDKKLAIFNHFGIQSKEKFYLNGNEAIGLGAISAGLKFYAAYPMTPATTILHYLSEHAKEAKLIVKQPEDEIAAVNMAIGASYAGARSMTSTSGGGFCLMTEGLGLSGVAEVPLVLINVMRPGPATGMPTWTGQGDLKFIINAAQDEFPRVVLAPGDPKEAFFLTRKAFELAEKYQTPVLVLIDKYLGESEFTIEGLTESWKNHRYSFAKKVNNYKRYTLTDSGISPRPIPGSEEFVSLTNSYEHNDLGFATEEGEKRTKMVDKRNRKFKGLEKEIPSQEVFGRKSGKIGLISWGSNKGPILQALPSLPEVSFLNLNWLWPFPKKDVIEFIKGHQSVFTLEANSLGQLNSLIREQTGIKIDKQFLKYDGRPFYPEEIIKNLCK